MEQRMFLEQRLQQRMVMTPRMQQAIKMLQMPTIELEALVEQEMVENPLLEEIPEDELQAVDVLEGSATLSPEAPEYELQPPEGPTDSDWDRTPAESSDKSEGEHLSEGRIELTEDWEKFFEDGSDTSATSPTGFDGPTDDEYDRIIPDSMTLREELERQLELQVETETDREIGQAILSALNEDGYLGVTVAELAEQTGQSIQAVERVLAIIQTFEPAGIGARTLSECLEIQYRLLCGDRSEAQRDDEARTPPVIPFNHAQVHDADQVGRGELPQPVHPHHVLEVIRHHLEDLERKRYQHITRALGIGNLEVQQIADQIAQLEPRPGRGLGAYQNEYITPDVFVEKIAGQWQVRVNDEGVPPLRISPRYLHMIEEKEQFDQETRRYLNHRLRAAVDLLKNIEQRKQTLYRVTSEIVSQQKDFLENGISQMKPMRLRDVADVVGVHETTVCRVVNGKYVDTPQGLFELKYFFSAGLESDSGEDASAKSVMDMIQTLVAEEEPRKPLSDQKLAEILNHKGIHVARRTVAKYRDQLGILPTNLRKRA
jgi:RNA polymerase sigma-54 factor